MRCYKVGEKIILELDKPLRHGERIEIVIRVEDPTALPPMEQEPEVVRHQQRFDPRSGYGFDPAISYTGVEQTPDTHPIHPAEVQYGEMVNSGKIVYRKIRPEPKIRPEALRRHGRK